MPRNSDIVPIVTTIDGTENAVTSAPLNAPHVTPTPRPMTIRAGVGAPACAARPIAREATAMIAAIDRSISPMMMRNAIASARMPFSEKLNVASERL